MESFEQKIKERNNLLKSQVESLTGRNELTEVIDALLKAGVAEEDLVEKAKYIRREADGKGGYKYIYSEPKKESGGRDVEYEKTYENLKDNPKDPKTGKIIRSDKDKKTDKVDKKEESPEEYERRVEPKVSDLVKLWKEKGEKREPSMKDLKELWKKHNQTQKSSESDLEKAKADKKQQKKIKKVMDEWKNNSLKRKDGTIVEDRKEALAIALSEAGLSKK